MDRFCVVGVERKGEGAYTTLVVFELASKGVNTAARCIVVKVAIVAIGTIAS